MQASNSIEQPPKNDNRRELIEAWQKTTNTAIEELLIFRSWLNAWLTFPGPIETELIIQVVDDLLSAGLGNWLFDNEADILKLADALMEECDNGKTET